MSTLECNGRNLSEATKDGSTQQLAEQAVHIDTRKTRSTGEFGELPFLLQGRQMSKLAVGNLTKFKRRFPPQL